MPEKKLMAGLKSGNLKVRLFGKKLRASLLWLNLKVMKIMPGYL